MSENTRGSFLRKKFHYFLVLAVIATTLLSWFNLNSYLIILLVFCRLFDGGPRLAIRSAVRNVHFRAYSALFIVELAGMLYTHDLFSGWKCMESKATLVAIPFVLCAGPFSDRNDYRRLLNGYCLLLAVICVYCLSNALLEYRWQHDAAVFFYHQLAGAVGINAVFFSGYVLVAIFFLLSDGLHKFQPILLFFFAGMLFLLSSRLMLLLLVAALVFYLFQPGGMKMKLMRLILPGILMLGILGATDNPSSSRYKELEPSRLARSFRDEFMTANLINGVSLRLFMWRSAIAILNENHAWLLGVSGGDSQIRLNEKYMAAGMSEGYLKYNFHDQYFEVLVHSGVTGEAVFIFFIASLIGLARSARTPETALTVGMIILLCMTESALEMQHGLFLCSFFPLLHLSGRSTSVRPLHICPAAPHLSGRFTVNWGSRSSLDPSLRSPVCPGS